MIPLFFYLLFLVSYFIHMTSRVPVLGIARFDLILVGLTTCTAFLLRKKADLASSDFSTRPLNHLLLYVLITIPFVEWPGSVVRFGIENMLKVIVFYYFSITLINDRRTLKIFVSLFIILQAYRILEPTYLHVVTGYWGDRAFSTVGGNLSVLYRLAGAPHDTVNPNQLAWVIVNTVPFLYYLGWQGRSTIGKILAACLFPVFVYALLLTGSRSGFLSLLVVILSIMLLGEKKLKRSILCLIVLLPLAFWMVGNLRDDQLTRYQSIYRKDVAGADTAAGRIKGLESGLSTVSSSILFGHGIGTSKETAANFLPGRSQLSHNLYIEILQELGIVGFLLFCLYVQGIWRNLGKLKEQAQKNNDDWVLRFGIALQVWVIMDLFYSLSCFGLSSWEWYLFGGISAACVRVIASEVTLLEKEKNLGMAPGAVQVLSLAPVAGEQE